MSLIIVSHRTGDPLLCHPGGTEHVDRTEGMRGLGCQTAPRRRVCLRLRLNILHILHLPVPHRLATPRAGGA